MLNPGVARIAEKNMTTAAIRDQIHAALLRDDDTASRLFDQLRRKNPKLAQAVAIALGGAGGAR